MFDNLIEMIKACMAGSCMLFPAAEAPPQEPQPPRIIQEGSETLYRDLLQPFDYTSSSGNYLASQFAQRRHDWKTASRFMDNVLRNSDDNLDVLNQAMILSMGSGDGQRAVKLARQIADIDNTHSSLAALIIITDALNQNDFAAAKASLKTMPDDSLTDFVRPLLHSWIAASEGTYDAEALSENTIHIQHAILIADYLDQPHHIEDLLKKAIQTPGLSLSDLEHLANAYAHIGKKDLALEIYGKLQQAWPENQILAKRIQLLQSGQTKGFLTPISRPQNGVAEALYDVSRLLFQEHSDDSARVFAQLALFMNPDMADAELLLGYLLARNAQYKTAISYFDAIQYNHEQYTEAQRMMADLYERMGETDKALSTLERLVKSQNDIEAVIQIGDIHRRAADFEAALMAYNRAENQFENGVIPAEFWQIHYARGMTYEQLGQWPNAEKDLLAALSFQPDQPLVLNYLGYAWADQGLHLDRALEMIRKAVQLQPSDGYITDSLGWVLYRMGHYDEAIPHLERAITLLPYDPVINDHLGDAYWQAGRKLEAKFQWKRAKNNAEDADLIKDIEHKLTHGLKTKQSLKQAQSSQNTDL